MNCRLNQLESIRIRILFSLSLIHILLEKEMPDRLRFMLKASVSLSAHFPLDTPGSFSAFIPVRESGLYSSPRVVNNTNTSPPGGSGMPTLKSIILKSIKRI